jgi:hypothetical protein
MSDLRSQIESLDGFRSKNANTVFGTFADALIQFSTQTVLDSQESHIEDAVPWRVRRAYFNASSMATIILARASRLAIRTFGSRV